MSPSTTRGGDSWAGRKYLFRLNDASRGWSDRFIVEAAWSNGDSEFLCSCSTANEAAAIAQAMQKQEKHP